MATPPDAHNLTDVLVVDDEPQIVELLEEYFRSRGLRVASAADGRSAVAALEHDPARYHLIVTDLQLPGLDGLGVLKAARQSNPSAYVVIVTGYASLDSAIQAVRLGAYDYLTKPFSLGQLDVILQRVQDRLALEQENRRLVRQIGQRDAPELRLALTAKLDSIEARLGRIEAAVRELGERLDGRRLP
jgi:DNA-binding NtrC family response regulator